LKTFGNSNSPIRPDAGQRWAAICDGYLAAQLLDWADRVEVRGRRQGAKIDGRRKLPMHDGLALRPDELQVIACALEARGGIGPGHLGDLTECGACRTAAQAETDPEHRSPRNHRRPLRSGFELPLELVVKAPVRSLRDNLIGRRLDHTGF